MANDGQVMPVELVRWMDSTTERATLDGDFLIVEVGKYWIIPSDDVIRWFRGENATILLINVAENDGNLEQ